MHCALLPVLDVTWISSSRGPVEDHSSSRSRAKPETQLLADYLGCGLQLSVRLSAPSPHVTEFVQK